MSDRVMEKPGPYRIELKGGYRYAWCSCGLSNYQPFCDGSHTSAPPGSKPLVFTQDRDRTLFMCGCKKTKKPPFCDGSHDRA
jgi:CDGSH iron-sulfur domain-containing protein 3